MAPPLPYTNSSEAPPTYNCLIVDDDPSARLIMANLVRQEPDLEIIEMLDSGEKALDFVNKNNDVHIMFLDIQMPGLSGLELVKALPDEHKVKTILTTGEKEFAVDAFALEVLDFIVKPIELARFKASVDRARRMIEQERKAGGLTYKEIFFKTSNRFVRVRTDEIMYVEALSDYVVLFLVGGQKHIIHSTMKAMEDKLASVGFMRVHRSYILNLKYVDSVAEHTAKAGGKSIPISKSYQDEFYDLIRKTQA